MRQREEILAKLEEFEAARMKHIASGDHEMQNFVEGSMSAFYYVLEMKNPYTGHDHRRPE